MDETVDEIECVHGIATIVYEYKKEIYEKIELKSSVFLHTPLAPSF